MKTQCDSEIVIHAYLHWGAEKTVKAMRGMFAFVLHDGRTDEVFVGRDAVGIKPLYHGFSVEGNLVWCTLSHVVDLCSLSHPSFGSELKVLHDQCENLSMFPAGHYYTTNHGIVKFYDPKWDQLTYTPEKRPTKAEIRDALKKAVRDLYHSSSRNQSSDSCPNDVGRSVRLPAQWWSGLLYHHVPYDGNRRRGWIGF